MSVEIPCKNTTLSLFVCMSLKSNSNERKKEKTSEITCVISEVFGPSGGAQTHEPRGPKPRVLSTELHPEIQKYHTRKSNLIVVKIVAKAMQLGSFDFVKSHKSPVAQGFPGFLKN